MITGYLRAIAALSIVWAVAPLQAAPPLHYGHTGPTNSWHINRHSSTRLKIQRRSDQEGYKLRILLDGGSTDKPLLSMQPGVIVIESNQSGAIEQPGNNNFGIRSWSHFSRRIPLPRDADIQNMQREDGEGYIILTIPRYR